MQKIEEIERFAYKFKNIFLQEYFRLTTAKPLKQLYHPHNFRDLRKWIELLILAKDLWKWIKKIKNSIFVS